MVLQIAFGIVLGVILLALVGAIVITLWIFSEPVIEKIKRTLKGKKRKAYKYMSLPTEKAEEIKRARKVKEIIEEDNLVELTPDTEQEVEV